MKVLHITNNYPTKNFPIFGIFVKEQIDSLTEKGIENEIFFMNTREKGKKEYFLGLFRIIKILISKRFDIVHCHHSYSGIIFMMTGISLFQKKIISYQGTPDIEGGNFLFLINSYFFNSIILKAKFNEYFNKSTNYLPNGTNMSFFIPMDRNYCKLKLNLDINKTYILFMDSYVERPYKRYDRYKVVIEILRNSYKLENIEELVLTNTPREFIPYYMNAASLHLLSSDVEGSPNSVKECLSCNTPVVSTPVGNVLEMIGDIDGCFVSKSSDPIELAELSFKALSLSEFNGREQFKQKKLDIETVGENLVNIYQKIISNEV